LLSGQKAVIAASFLRRHWKSSSAW